MSDQLDPGGLYNAIIQANARIRQRIGEYEIVRETPLKRSPRLEERHGCKRIYLKLECLQNTGSFKLRGATNAVMTAGERDVFVAASAGNHGLGLAVASNHRDRTCHVFMPTTTPLTKRRLIELYGAKAHLEGDAFDETQALAREFSDRHSYRYIHPYDDPAVIAGQGSIGLELVEQWDALVEEGIESAPPDVLVVPAGGGGLSAGVGTVIRREWPTTQLIIVEPANIASLSASYRHNHPRTPGHVDATVADGAAVANMGGLALRCLNSYIESEKHIIRASENDIAAAMVSLLEDTRIVAEGAGALPLAGLIQHARDLRGQNLFQGKKVVLLVSGGNVDITSLSRVVTRGLLQAQRQTTYRFRVPDKPGVLASITAGIVQFATPLNVIELTHSRRRDDLAFGRADVLVTVETEGAEHRSRVLDRLKGTFEHDGFEVTIANE